MTSKSPDYRVLTDNQLSMNLPQLRAELAVKVADAADLEKSVVNLLNKTIFLQNLANTHEAANLERQGKIEALQKDKEELLSKLKEANKLKQEARSELNRLQKQKEPRKKMDYSLVPEEILAELGLAVLENRDDDVESLEDACRDQATYWPHVQQEIVLIDGIKRFRENKLITQLVKQAGGHGLHDMNYVATLDASREDRAQLAQLIGYSVDGYQSLDYSLPVEEE
jgi:hypothetical protein